MPSNLALTMDSTVSCGHGAPGNISQIEKQSILKVGGSAVLIDGSFGGAVVSGCGTVTNNSGNFQCSTTGNQTAGTASKLTVNGDSVLLDTATGPLTLATVGGNAQSYSVDFAGQTKLKTG